MSNFQVFSQVTGGNVANAPAQYSASTEDDLTAITAVGYLNDKADIVEANDVIFINYSTGTTPVLTAGTVVLTGGNYNFVAGLPGGGGGGGAVSSVFTRTGAVVAAAGDYTATEITNVPSGGITGTNVDAALKELDTNKVNASSKFVPYNSGFAGYGGGGTSTSIPVATMTEGDYVSVTLAKATNIVPFRAEAAAGQINITFASDPGAVTQLYYFAYRA